MGIRRLSKSLRGRTSISIPAQAITRDNSESRVIKKVATKIAAKQVTLPAAVFPFVKGIATFPHILPARLASPSPRAKAQIPIEAGTGSKRRAVIKTPEARVTGPRTNLFSSRFLAAACVTADITGTVKPLILKSSVII